MSFKIKLKEQLVALLQLAEDKVPEEMPKEEVKAEYMEATLTDGTIVKYDKLEVGAALTVITVEGEVPAPDATHELENGTLITTKDGLITEIVEGAPVVTEDEMFSEFKRIFEKLSLQISEKNTENKTLKSDFAEIKAQFTEVLTAVKEISKTVELVSQEPSKGAIHAPKTNLVSYLKTKKIK
jgi:uncharacterized protein YbaR (Trm112 family)